MRVRFLGTGTSTGVPAIGCRCPACLSTDSHDKRLRASAIVETGGKRLLIDCGPDFRRQIIEAGAPALDAALITHSHYDHVGGIDDLRPYCYRRENGFPLYCRPDVAADLRAHVPYGFAVKHYPGAPVFDLHEIHDEPFDVDGVTVTPLPVMHYRLPIIGFRIGDFAYITDAKVIPPQTFDRLKGVRHLVINALRHEEHLSHMTLGQALAAIDRINPDHAWLTHIADSLGPAAEVAPTLPERVTLAYDGLTLDL